MNVYALIVNSGPDPRLDIQYQALGSNEIRLIRVLPGPEHAVVELKFLPHASLEALPPYYALSYTWGDPSKTQAAIFNGIAVQITENLADFLRYRRRDLPDKIDTLWIDAICINQKDNGEKNIQLLLMRQVYENANRTIVWLGAEKEECEKGLELIDKIPRCLDGGAGSGFLCLRVLAVDVKCV